jgi:hypothetical protein
MIDYQAVVAVIPHSSSPGQMLLASRGVDPSCG